DDDMVIVFFFFQAEDGIRDWSVTGVQTCALPISPVGRDRGAASGDGTAPPFCARSAALVVGRVGPAAARSGCSEPAFQRGEVLEIGRASCRERGWKREVGETLQKKEEKRLDHVVT